MRIAKYIANAGVCSRRDAEKLIEQTGVIGEKLEISSFENKLEKTKPWIN